MRAGRASILIVFAVLSVLASIVWAAGVPQLEASKSVSGFEEGRATVVIDMRNTGNAKAVNIRAMEELAEGLEMVGVTQHLDMELDPGEATSLIYEVGIVDGMGAKAESLPASKIYYEDTQGRLYYVMTEEAAAPGAEKEMPLKPLIFLASIILIFVVYRKGVFKMKSFGLPFRAKKEEGTERDLPKENTELREALAEAEKGLQGKEEMVERLIEKLDKERMKKAPPVDYEQTLWEMEEKMKVLELEVGERDNLVGSKLSKIEKLKSALKEKRSEATKAKKRAELLESKLEKITSEKGNIEEEIAKRDVIIEKQEAAAKELESGWAGNLEMMENLEAEMKELKKAVSRGERAEAKLEDLRKETNAMKKELAILAEDAGKLPGVIEALEAREKELSAVKEKETLLKEEVKERRKELHSLEASVAKLKSENSDLTQRLSETKVKRSKHALALLDRAKELQAQVEEKDSLLAEKDGSIMEHEKELKKLRKKLEQLELQKERFMERSLDLITSRP